MSCINQKYSERLIELLGWFAPSAVSSCNVLDPSFSSSKTFIKISKSKSHLLLRSTQTTSRSSDVLRARSFLKESPRNTQLGSSRALRFKKNMFLYILCIFKHTKKHSCTSLRNDIWFLLTIISCWLHKSEHVLWGLSV